MGYCVVQCSGYVSTDPKINTTQSGLVIMSFSIPIKNKKETGWLKCSLFGKSAEYVQGKIAKGTFVSFSGRMLPYSFRSKTGEEVKGFECQIAPFCLDFPQDRSETQASSSTYQLSAPVSPVGYSGNIDDIPF